MPEQISNGQFTRILELRILERNFDQNSPQICQNSENPPVKENTRIWAIFPANAEILDLGKIQKFRRISWPES